MVNVIIFSKKKFFWPRREAYRILVPRPGTEPRPSAVKAPSPNHWTAREYPVFSKFMQLCNHHHNPILKHLPHPQKFTLTCLQSIHAFNPRQTLIYFLCL